MGLSAIVRLPSPLLAEGEVTHIERRPLDVDRAIAQHSAYLALLEAHGVRLILAPRCDDHPDGVFVEDALFMVERTAVLTRPGAPSRRGEVGSIATVIDHLGIASNRVEAPATIDGGDVLVTKRHIFVGSTSRSNEAATEALGTVTARLGRTIVRVPVTGCLHLKSAITVLPDGSLVAVPGWVPEPLFSDLGYTVRAANEPSGGDVLCLGQSVILPADAPQTAAALERWGFTPVTIDVSELQKVEAGVTCMSVLITL